MSVTSQTRQAATNQSTIVTRRIRDARGEKIMRYAKPVSYCIGAFDRLDPAAPTTWKIIGEPQRRAVNYSLIPPFTTTGVEDVRLIINSLLPNN